MPDGQREGQSFTVYLEGHEGHQGNVLLHAFLLKVDRLTKVLNKLERVFIVADSRQTDFEIVDADKINPTLLTLKPVPKVRSYNPAPALEWGLAQIETVARGGEPDARVHSDLARDLVDLATRQQADSYKAFWINGYTNVVRFDDAFRHNAERLVVKRAIAEAAQIRWHVGISRGSVVGQLKAVDDISDDREFIIVPPTGTATITCKFPESARKKIGEFLFTVVKVKGRLHYDVTSPFPTLVEVDEDGIEPYPSRPRRRSMLEMRGAFAGRRRREAELDSLLNG